MGGNADSLTVTFNPCVPFDAAITVTFEGSKHGNQNVSISKRAVVAGQLQITFNFNSNLQSQGITTTPGIDFIIYGCALLTCTQVATCLGTAYPT